MLQESQDPEPTSISVSMSNASFMELLTENANLKKKIALLQDSGADKAADDNPWKKELSIAEHKIADLTRALEDRINEVQLIEDKVKLQELNATLADKIQAEKEVRSRVQAQLQDAKDQADLLEFRVLELEEDHEKVQVDTVGKNDLIVQKCHQTAVTFQISVS